MVSWRASVKGSACVAIEVAHFAFQGNSGHKACDLMLFNCTSWDEDRRARKYLGQSGGLMEHKIVRIIKSRDKSDKAIEVSTVTGAERQGATVNSSM